MAENHSTEWVLSKELAKANKRLAILFVSVIIVFCLTIVGIVGSFVWYINQFDFVSCNENISFDSSQGGTNNYIGNDGEITNG